MEFIKQNGSVLIESPCKKCGTVYVDLKEGKGPHIAELRCPECRAHVQWMSKANYEIYLCYLTDDPVQAVNAKLMAAEESFKKIDLEGDWIERKTALKYRNELVDYFTTKMEGHEHYVGYGHE